jgi:hypothetical protein
MCVENVMYLDNFRIWRVVRFSGRFIVAEYAPIEIFRVIISVVRRCGAYGGNHTMD